MPYDSAEEEIIDLDRYESATGWQPKDPYEKQRKLARKLYPDYGCSPFEVHPANKSAARAGNHTTGPLFGDMWRRGEVAVLFGESGVGKSILAMHIAETIARGKRFAEGFAVPRAQPVVYFDFELTDIQFRERYSVQPGPNPRRRQRYQFSERLLRASVGEITSLPDVFKGDVRAYIRYWMATEAESVENDVFVIDNVSFLTGSQPDANLVRNLKRYAAEYGKSFLILATSREKRIPHELKLADATAHKHIIEQADSVFALARSTCGEEIRYLKHLKSRTAEPQFTDQNVAVLRLERTTGPQASCLPAAATAAATASSLPPSANLFLGLTYLGTSPERDHHRDYIAEFLNTQKRNRTANTRDRPKPLPPTTARQALTNGILNGSYARYLKGEP